MSPAPDCHGCEICERCDREIRDAQNARTEAVVAVCEFLEREGYAISAREARRYFESAGGRDQTSPGPKR